jgi:ParB family chromosome partitioning protein
MAKKTGLGRGLSALIPGSESNLSSSGINYVHISQIIPNPRQPRSKILPEEIEELTSSIKEHGILQPLVVSYDDALGKYILIAGERRLRAASQAGLDTVPVISREVSDQQRLELALVENLQRTDLSPLEAAEAYRQLSEDFLLSHEEIAARVGKSRVSITNTLRLLKLPAQVKNALAKQAISEGHARALLTLPDTTSQVKTLQIIIQRGLNVRQTEKLIHQLIAQSKENQTPVQQVSPELLDFEDRIRQRFGTKVKIQPRSSDSGSITMNYYSDEEFNHLVSLLLGEII